MIVLQKADLPAPPSYFKESKTGREECLGSECRDSVGCLWGDELQRHWGQSPPFSEDKSVLLCLCGGFIYFSLSFTHHRMEWGGGRDSYSRNMLRNSPALPSLPERKTESSLQSTGPAWPAIVISLSSPPFSSPSSLLQPEDHPPCFSNFPGMVLPQDLCTNFSLPRKCSSDNTCITPSSLCSNATFTARPFLTYFNSYNPPLPLPSPLPLFSPLVITTDLTIHFSCLFFLLVSPTRLPAHKGRNYICFVHCSFLSAWSMVYDQ